MSKLITVKYEGPDRGIRLLAKELTDAGLQVDYESPQERRSGVEQGIIQGVIYVAGALTGGGVCCRSG